MRRLTALLPVAIALALLWSAPARAQSRGKEIVVGFGAEPRTMLAVTIVDWTTNNMLEHIYDRLLDRDAKTFKPKPMLAESWRIGNDTTWDFLHLLEGAPIRRRRVVELAPCSARHDRLPR